MSVAFRRLSPTRVPCRHLVVSGQMDAHIVAWRTATGSTSLGTEIVQASELLGSGAITQAEFDAVKTKALA